MPTKRCAFCSNPRTNKRGEHIWDDWLNREDGRHLRYHYDVTEFASDDVVIHQYPSRSLAATKDVVCDDCNNGWMSVVTSEAKSTLEGFIRHERSATLLELGVLTVAAFAVMKSIVLDCSAERDRKRLFSPLVSSDFRLSLTSGDAFNIPNGVQIWLASYRFTRQVEARFWINGLVLKSGRFAGFQFLLITYQIRAFVFQLAYPRWSRLSPSRVNLPFLTQGSNWDDRSLPLWPYAGPVEWPPASQLDSGSLESFQQRFGVETMRTLL